jgi:hypothetical protein
LRLLVSAQKPEIILITKSPSAPGSEKIIRNLGVLHVLAVKSAKLGFQQATGIHRPALAGKYIRNRPVALHPRDLNQPINSDLPCGGYGAVCRRKYCCGPVMALVQGLVAPAMFVYGPPTACAE